MTDETQAIAAFWRVFRERASKLAEISTADHPIYDLILDELQQIDPGLSFEFSSESQECEFIVTAEGDRSLFPLVDSIVACAPKIPGWVILPLKPKLGFPVTATWEGIEVNIADVVFDPLERAGSKDLGLRLFLPGLAPEHVEAAHSALLRALDFALGEREFAESVQYTEVVPLPDDASAEDYIRLIDLEDYVNWRKKKQEERTGR